MFIVNGGGKEMSGDIRLHEYDSMRDEILENIRQIYDATKFAILTVGGLVAWLLERASHWEGQVIAGIAAWLPFVVAVYWGSQAAEIRKALYGLAEYVRSLEKQLASEGSGWIGWQHYLDQNSHVETRLRRFHRTHILWPMLYVSSFVFGGYYFAAIGLRL